LKGTSSWRDVYADIKLFATIEVADQQSSMDKFWKRSRSSLDHPVFQVLQALSKIVPFVSLLPVALVQSIVGFTGTAAPVVMGMTWNAQDLHELSWLFELGRWKRLTREG
jgi:hypothetical protein